MLEYLMPQIVAGISRGMLYFLVASGLTLVFGVLKVINFAHGAMYMLGAFFCYTIAKLLVSVGDLSFWSCLIIVPIIVGAIGGLIERFILRRIYKSEHLYQLLITFALTFVISDLVRIIWGSMPINVSKPSMLRGNIPILGATVPLHYVFIVILSSIIAIGLWLFLYKSKYGNVIRAAAADSDMSRVLGIDCERLFSIVFMIGCGLAAIGGVAATTMLTPMVGMDMDVILPAFIIVVVGGLGSVFGALVGSLVIGLVESIGIMLIPTLSAVLIYVVMAVMLIVRPSGLFGEAERRP